MANIAEDYKILRNEVLLNLLDNNELKILFKKKNYNIVDTLIEIEKLYFNNDTYLKGNTIIKNEAQQKIEELRNIVNIKDKLMENIKHNASK